MPSLSRAQARASNDSYAPKSTPTAIFVGGTSGIGEGMANSFARAVKGNANIIIIGRNRVAAERIISLFPKPSTGVAAKHEFVECDVSLMKNVHATTTALLSRLDKVNFLVLSPGYLSMARRNDTSEGIDHKLAVVYYARWTIIDNLLPLLHKAKDAGEEAKVMSVLAAGLSFARAVDINDLGMVKKYSATGATLTAITYSDLMLEKFSSLHPTLTFIHSHPGEVATPILIPTTFPLVLLKPFAYFFTWVYCVSKETCAEYMWYALHRCGQGFHRSGNKGEDVARKNYKGTEEAKEALWSHTQALVKSSAD